MSLNINQIIVLLVYSFGINLVLVSFANMGIGIECNSLDNYQFNQTYNQTELEQGINSNPITLINSVRIMVDLALGRCDGIPYWLFLVLELPIIVGLLYVLRGFVGAT